MDKAFEIKGLTFTYPTAKETTIKGVSFAVKKGTIFGLLGPSGAGKSTTQKILAKLLWDYQGEIRFFGRDLRTFGKEFYERVGVGFEMPVHFNRLTARENLSYFAGLYKTKADYEALLTRVGLKNDANRPVGEYSKGMKVRLNFVRALLNDPEFLFLDEPTNGLDPSNAKILKDMILEMKAAGKTIFITTHLMGDVEQLCDEVAFMTKGSISEVSSPRELKLRYGKKEVIVESIADAGERKTVFPLEGIGHNDAFLDVLKNDRVVTIHSGETTMEDIFIKVTGEAKYE
ncbi:MAG TPA: ATP-binding protein [Acholeplasmatales bacterium]|nr:MAG: ATP-binding protein [Tenericutes bacterium GWF2_57_13]HAQ56885.1 ATP-binding protein [Acholeplasmatales bacterium]